uniref:P2X purinoreceptor 7 intracellular domain-containing protein n=1 Tax=Latimeria chalumnae TaxID=7897 RepID=M3XJS4_LATCH
MFSKILISRCLCGYCQPMPTRPESICCREVSELSSKITHDMRCITQLSGFQVNCLDPEVLELSFYEYLEYEGPIGDAEQIHEIYRYIAYRRLARWIWHRLGRGNRRPLPSCAVKKIREQFPSEEYTGFQYAQNF